MEYQWEHVEDFLTKLEFIIEARKLTTDTDLSKSQLVEAINEALEPHNLKKITGHSDLIPINKLAKPERNHKIILARFGIGYLGNTSFRNLSNKFKVSTASIIATIKRFEKCFPPTDEVRNLLYWWGVTYEIKWDAKRYLQCMADVKCKEILEEQLDKIARVRRLYADPIKKDIYHRYLEKVCQDPNGVQLDYIKIKKYKNK